MKNPKSCVIIHQKERLTAVKCHKMTLWIRITGMSLWFWAFQHLARMMRMRVFRLARSRCITLWFRGRHKGKNSSFLENLKRNSIKFAWFWEIPKSSTGMYFKRFKMYWRIISIQKSKREVMKDINRLKKFVQIFGSKSSNFKNKLSIGGNRLNNNRAKNKSFNDRYNS